MNVRHTLPGDIERTSMSIIAAELAERNIILPPEHEAVVKRVIHTTADFDYAENLRFTSRAAELGQAALRRGIPIVTDTNMAKAGVSKPSLKTLGCELHCFMADPEVAMLAKEQGLTRAAVSMEKAARELPGAILAVGNAPTALLTLCQLMAAGRLSPALVLRPALVIGVPVGFVNVEESKEILFAACEACGVPAIAAMGRKGGSNVAAAICNALLYAATETLDPSARGWQ
jgi:precorrin-8X/cobalt-precorrin-8 methylmutase